MRNEYLFPKEVLVPQFPEQESDNESAKCQNETPQRCVGLVTDPEPSWESGCGILILLAIHHHHHHGCHDDPTASHIVSGGVGAVAEVAIVMVIVQGYACIGVVSGLSTWVVQPTERVALKYLAHARTYRKGRMSY